MPIHRHEFTKSQLDFFALFPKHPFKLQAVSPQEMALALYVEDKPAGVIFAEIFPLAQEGYLTYLYVLPSLRGRQIGSTLMHRLLEELKNTPVRYLLTKWDDSLAEEPSLRKILQKNAWSPPNLLSRRYFFEPLTFTPPWMKAQEKLPKECSIFPWDKLSKKEHAFLEMWLGAFASSPSYSPFSALPFDPLNSLGLRLGGQLAGWIITHRLEPKLLRYTALFAFPEAREAGAAIPLLRRSIQKHVEKERDLIGMMEINFKFSPPHWLRFIHRNLAPYAIRIEETYESFIKILN